MDQTLNSSRYCCDLSRFSVCNCLLSLGSSWDYKCYRGWGMGKKRRREEGVDKQPFCDSHQYTRKQNAELSFAAYFGVREKNNKGDAQGLCIWLTMTVCLYAENLGWLDNPLSFFILCKITPLPVLQRQNEHTQTHAFPEASWECLCQWQKSYFDILTQWNWEQALQATFPPHLKHSGAWSG